jgi:hypothetical protein
MKTITFTALLMTLPLFAQAQLDSQWEQPILDLVRTELQVGPESVLPDIVTETYTREGDRDRWMITLSDIHLGEFRLLLDGPRDFRSGARKHSVLLITAGFFAGTKPVDLLPQTGDQIIAAFEYTPNPEFLIFQPDQLLRTLKAVPGRLYLSVKWLRDQNWFEPNQFHLFAVSLGALYMPVAERLMQKDGMYAASTIYAFGGGGVKGSLREMFRQWMNYADAENLAEILALSTLPYDPAIYLSKLVGPKLIIHATEDEVFPRDSQKILNDKLTEAKMICDVIGNHIDIGRTNEINLTLALLEPWVKSINQGLGFPLIDSADTACAASM